MLKYIFSALLIIAVWTTVLLLKLPIWIAVVATIVILAILLTIVIYRMVKAKRAAKEIVADAVCHWLRKAIQDYSLISEKQQFTQQRCL